MKYGNVNGVDKKISRMVQGTVYFKQANKDEAFTIFDAVFEGGLNTFDTAHGYGGGECEQVLGEWIQSRGVRDQVNILTKGAHPYNGEKRVTPEHITSDITDSLERLGTDFVELYILHRDDETKPVGPIVEVLNEHHKAGRIGVFGGSNWTHKRIAEANAYAAENGLVGFGASSPQFSLAEMVKPAWDGCISVGGDQGEAARAWYKEHNFPLFTWASVAGGFMTGKFTRDNLDTFEEYFDKVAVHAYAYENNFQRLDRAKELAEKKGVSVIQLGLAYVLSQPMNIFALVGNRSVSDFQSNNAAMELELTADELAWLETGD